MLSRFGAHFRKWTEILHSNPLAEVSTNFHISSLQPVQRHTSGLPPVTNSFLMVMEPFATAVRSHPSISGIKTYDTEHIMMHADATPLLPTDLKNSIYSI